MDGASDDERVLIVSSEAHQCRLHEPSLDERWARFC